MERAGKVWVFFTIITPDSVLKFLSSRARVAQGYRLALTCRGRVGPAPVGGTVITLNIRGVAINSCLARATTSKSIAMASGERTSLILGVSVFTPCDCNSCRARGVLSEVIATVLCSRGLCAIADYRDNNIRCIHSAKTLILSACFALDGIFSR